MTTTIETMSADTLVRLLCYGQSQDGTLVDSINWFCRYLSPEEKVRTLTEFSKKFSLDMSVLTGEDEDS